MTNHEFTPANLYLKPQRKFVFFLLFVLLQFLYGCGGGGGGGSGSEQVSPAPTLNFSASSLEVEVTETVLLSWSSTNATSCVASGGWSGTKASSGSQDVTTINVGSNIYGLTCSGSGGSISASITVIVYGDFSGLVVDDYLSGSIVYIVEDAEYYQGNLEQGYSDQTSSDLQGAFSLRYSNGVVLALGGTDTSTSNNLDQLILSHHLSGYSEQKIISPITTVASFLDEPEVINELLGIDASIDVFITDPIENRGDAGIYDYYYEKGAQLTVLALALEQISKKLNQTSTLTSSLHAFDVIAQVAATQYQGLGQKTDIETDQFINALFAFLREEGILLVDDSNLDDTVTALTSVLPIMQVKQDEDLTSAILNFATSKFLEEIVYIANGTATSQMVDSYTADIFNYIASSEGVLTEDLVPNIQAWDDSISGIEDESITINVLGNDSFVSAFPISLAISETAQFGQLAVTSTELPSIIYTPDPNINGEDSFQYIIEQNNKYSIATVSITLEPVNDAPSVESASTVTVLDWEQTIDDVNIFDIDGDEISVLIEGIDAEYFVFTDDELKFNEVPNYHDTDLYQISLNVSDGTINTTKDINIGITSDPLYRHQWHLFNTGQSNFASLSALSGSDINTRGVYAIGITGEGVLVSVLDEDLELPHEDLAPNIVNGSWNFLNESNDPTVFDKDIGHGTSVAGIIGARGWNNIGVRGVAPQASIIGYNFLQAPTDSNQVLSWGIDSPGGISADIYNMSYGADYGEGDTTYPAASYLSETLWDALREGTSGLRDGKGAVYLQAAGNGFDSHETEFCGASTQFTCTSIIADNYTHNPYIMIVGALNSNDRKSSYSTPGAGLWVSGYGGEYGWRYPDAPPEYTNYILPAIMTTDVSGCSFGSTRNNSNEFDGEYGPHEENPSCNYTSTFNGTSAATPVVTGVVALLLEANPDLTWRDVKHILASTAERIDSGNSLFYEGIRQIGWQLNDAGYRYHDWYGFGKVNVQAAIEMATDYQEGSLGEFVVTDWVDTGDWVTITAPRFNRVLNISKPIGSAGVIEYVRVSVGITGEPDPKSIGLRLISPSGTEINIHQPFSNLEPASNYGVDWDFWPEIGVSAFYGEMMTGDWTLIVDDYGDDDDYGDNLYFGIEIYGH